MWRIGVRDYCGGSYEELSPICGRRGQETTREVGCHQSVEC